MKYLKRFVNWMVRKTVLYRQAQALILAWEKEAGDWEVKCKRSWAEHIRTNQNWEHDRHKLEFMYDQCDRLQNNVIDCDRLGSLMRFNQDTFEEPVKVVIEQERYASVRGPYPRTTVCVTLCPEEIFWNLDRNAGEHMRSYLEKKLAGQITKIVMESERANGMKAR